MSYLLIVDDDPDTRQILADICNYMGHETEVAENGMQGIQKARTRIPDLILLDIMMPDMNGLQMLSRLRSNPATNDVPVIVLSAIGADQMQGMPGVVGVFHKSHMNVSQLRKGISQILASNSSSNRNLTTGSTVAH